jgi:hypothetical protein
MVLGMHRSGTSIATRLGNLLGLAICRPGDLVRGHGGNERGHWESTALVAENDRLLSRLRARWWCPPSTLADVERLATAADERASAREVFDGSYPNKPWVWKDPRTCLTLPFWLAALEVKAAVILTLRDPLEVAASVHARDGLSAEFALALWERHMRSAVQAAEGLPVLVTTFDEMTGDPVRWCEQTSEFLCAAGLAVRMPPDPAGITAFVHSGLRHQRSSNLRHRRSDLSGEQAALWGWLLGRVGSAAHFDRPDDMPSETPATAPLFEEARRAFGLVPGEPGLGAKAREFVSSSGVPLFHGPSPRGRSPAGPRKVSVIVLGDGRVNPRLISPSRRLPPELELVVVQPAEDPDDPLVPDADTRVVRGSGHLSRAERLNVGADVASGDVLVFLDSPDVTPRPGWLPRLTAALGAEVGAVGPAFVPADGKGERVVGLRPTDVRFNVAWIPAPATAEPVAVPSLSLRTLVTTRRRFELAGGFDAGMDGVGREDIDFCLRLWRSGYACLAVPAAEVLVSFVTEESDPAALLRNALRTGLVHLTGAALTEHLGALATHPLFPAALAQVTGRDVGRRRRAVDALACYDIDAAAEIMRVGAFRALTGRATGGTADVH